LPNFGRGAPRGLSETRGPDLVFTSLPTARERAYKKFFRATIASRDRLQLVATARVRRILPHPAFSRRKNLSIFVFKICFEIFRHDTTLYFIDICAAQNRKMERKSVSRGRGVT
jgi:hypothetical protein